MQQYEWTSKANVSTQKWGRRKEACVGRSLQGCCYQQAQSVWQTNVVCLRRCLAKIRVQKVLLCICLCSVWTKAKHNPEKVLSYSAIVVNVPCCFLYLNIWQQTSSLCCIFVFKMQYLTPFLSVILIPLWVLRVLVYNFYSAQELSKGKKNPERWSSKEKSFSALVSFLLCWILHYKVFPPLRQYNNLSFLCEYPQTW